MKHITIGLGFLAVLALTACNSNGSKSTDSTPAGTESSSTAPAEEVVYACEMHPEVTGKKGEKCPKCNMELTEVKKTSGTVPASTNSAATGTVALKDVVAGYLALKNDLTKDNSSAAAASGKTLENAFKNLGKAGLTAEQAKDLEEIQADAVEHAEHIGTNAGKIGHQREHFETLSKDVYDLVKTFGAGQTLYKDFCPMYNDKKGAFWLSETKEIKNPYMGKAMITCGTVQEEIK